MEGHAPRKDASHPPASLEATSQSKHVLQKNGRDWTRVDQLCHLMDSLLPKLPPLSLVPWLHSGHHPNSRGRDSSNNLPVRILPEDLPCSLACFLVGTAMLSSPEVSHCHVTCPGECQVSPSLEPRALTLFYGVGLSGATTNFIHQLGTFPTVMLNL